MNRWILRGLVTAGFAGAAWALSSTAASADTTEPDRPAGLTVTIGLGRTSETSDGEQSHGLDVGVTIGADPHRRSS